MSHTLRIAALLMVTSCLGQPLAAQTAPFEPVASEVAEAARILAQAHPAKGPGVMAIVARDGQAILATGRGQADPAKGTAITAETVFPLGSMTKQFTAATILLLAEDGLLSLDDPLSKHVPGWPQPGSQATIRQLLGHTSGIADFSKVPGWIGQNRHREFSTQQLLDVMRPLGSKADPGAEWEYNNGGYVLLGAIIEKVSGRPWHGEMKRRIFEPLGLSSIAYAADGVARPTLATGHDREGGKQVPVQLSNLSISGAAGGLVATAGDVARWNAALHGGRLLKPASYALMTAPGRLNDGTATAYGFGLRLGQLRGLPAYVHGGSLAGYRTDGMYVPDRKLFVGVFGNSAAAAVDGGDLMLRLAALAAGAPLPELVQAPVDRAKIEPLLGTYMVDGDERARAFFARDGRYFLGIGDFEAELAPGGNDRFYRLPAGLTWFDFKRLPGGAIEMEINDVGEAAPRVAKRTGAVAAPFTVAKEVLATYAGAFQTETVLIRIALEQDGKLWVSQGDSFRAWLRPVSETEFMVDGAPMKVVFEPSSGVIDKITLHRGARQLHGQRVKP